MKRSTKALTFKPETLRQLSSNELHTVQGGVVRTGNNCNMGGGSGSENSTDNPFELAGIKRINSVAQFGP